MTNKYFLLGNGFDLHHNLPTRYIHIIRIFSYWSQNYKTSFKSIGELYNSYFASFPKNIELDRPNNEMKQFYLTHKSKLDNVHIENEQILDSFANCFWFGYFSKVILQDIGWIDFENEIQKILELFQFIIENKVEDFEIKEAPNFAQFKVLHSKSNLDKIVILNNDILTIQIDRDFLDNHPLSAKCSYRTDDIAEYLFQELIKVKKIINFYIVNFINSVLDSTIKSQNIIPYMSRANIVINLNYTDTVESVYGISSDRVIHYHGEAIRDNIVLGINSYIDETSAGINPNSISFTIFKKYYQRIIQGNDSQYINCLLNLKKEILKRPSRPSPDLFELLIIGHSLDKSDEDIIKELFELFDKIYIYYYNISDYGKYIRKLISIFGEKKFLKMRNDYKILFVKLPEYVRELPKTEEEPDRKE